MAYSTIDYTPVRGRAALDVLPTKEPAHLPPTHPQFILLQDGPRVSTYDFPPPPKRPAGLSKRASQLALKLARRLLNRPKLAKGLTDAERQARDADLVQSNVKRFARGEMGWETVQGLDGKIVDLTGPRYDNFARASPSCQDWESVLGADEKKVATVHVAPVNVVPVGVVLGKVAPEQYAPADAASKDREAEKRKKCLSTVLEARESVILDGLPLAAEKYPFPKEPATDLTVSSLGVLPVRYEDHLPVEQLAIDVKAAWHADDGAEPSRMKRILSLQSMRFAEKQAREREAREAPAEAKATLKVDQKRTVPKRRLKKSLSMQMQRFAGTTSLLRATREEAVAAESVAKDVADDPPKSADGGHAGPVSSSMRNVHYAEQRAAPPGIKIMVDPLTADHPSLRSYAFSNSVPPPIPEKSTARAGSSNNPLSVQRKSQSILLASLNSTRIAAKMHPLVIMPLLGLRVQSFAAVELPPLPPSKPATKASHIGTQINRDQLLSDATQARATILVSPPNMGEMSVGELWRSGKYKRHKFVAKNHKLEDHRYTLFPTFEPNTDFDGYDVDDIIGPDDGIVETGDDAAAQVELLATSGAHAIVEDNENLANAQEARIKLGMAAPARFELEGKLNRVAKGGAARCACLEYNAYEVVVDTKWTAIGVGKTGDGRWVVGFG
ncbi:hypothetical protein B0A48_11823 [Cryoendolithus antarcticus]|uniref:Uncharacterized protein n=1 Tax=Cryoendolithus antarcticus TaxID=1507870 RepID=A0A1V8ST82_9PEZI|nr:hypothetical protein B0A48_11823 [Cryoendolithus antarcticus]